MRIELHELTDNPIPDEVVTNRFQLAVRQTSQTLRRQLALDGEPLVLSRDGGASWRLRTDGIAGTLSIDRHDVEVRPKFLDRETTADWRLILLRLVEIATNVRLGFLGPISAAPAQASFYDHVAIAMANSIRRAEESGPITVFRRVPDELPYLRGRLDTRIQIKHIYSRPSIIAQELDLLLADNDLSRLLKWAVQFLQTRSRTAFARAGLDFVGRYLAAIPAELPDRTILSGLQLQPQHAAWQEALDLALILAHSQSAGPRPGHFATPGIVFNSVRLFERLVSVVLNRAAALSRASGADWRSTGKITVPWFFPQQSGENVRNAIPDDGLRVDSQLALLIDAKYKGDAKTAKLSPPTPVRADVYQAAAFMSVTECNRVLLVYPKANTTFASDLPLRKYGAKLMGRDVLFCTVALDIASLAEQSPSILVQDFQQRIVDILNS